MRSAASTRRRCLPFRRHSRPAGGAKVLPVSVPFVARFPDGIVRYRNSNRPSPSAGRDLLDDPKAKMTGSKLVGPSSVRCSFNFQVGSFDTSQLAIPRLACRALGCDEDNRPVQGCANGRRVLLLSPKDRSRRQLRQRSESPRPASSPHVSRFVYGRR